LTGLQVAVDGSGLEQPRAGVGVYTTEILRSLAVDRPDCRLVVYAPDDATVPSAPGISVRSIPRTRFFGRHVQWPSRLRKARPDAFFGPVGALPLGDVGCPSVVTIHDLAIYKNPDWFPRRQPLATRLVVPRSVARADALIAVSEHTAHDLVDMFSVDPARIDVVSHGVGKRFHPLAPEDLVETKARLKLPDRFILFVGTIQPRKNLPTLLEAWAMMRDRPDLVVVGSWGWRFEAIRQQMERLGPRVHHISSLDPAQLPAVYNLARVVAHPAWYEGFGLPPLEAMACGTPVIVSDRSSLPEVVGEAGMVVPADDPDAWRDALERLLGDASLAAGMRRLGILRAAEFSWSRAAAQTWHVMDRVVDRRR